MCYVQEFTTTRSSVKASEKPVLLHSPNTGDAKYTRNHTHIALALFKQWELLFVSSPEGSAPVSTKLLVILLWASQRNGCQQSVRVKQMQVK
jgi:hypothetical protein